LKINKKIKSAVVGAVSLVLVASGASMASAATPQENGSDGPMYFFDADLNLVSDPAYTFDWDQEILGSAGDTSYEVPTICPSGTDGAAFFLSPVGQERTVLNWNAYATALFNPQPTVPGNKEIYISTLTPETFINGNARGAKAAGGNYSLGVACTINNGVTVVGAFYRTIAMTPVTGEFTLSPVTTGGGEPPVEEPAPEGTQGTVALAPTVTSAVNGVLSLSVPAGAAATFGAPTLIDNKSTTTGTLGAVTVNDGRVLTVNGWDLTANVADFVNSVDATSIIGKSQLGVAPSVTAAGTTATGVTAAAAQLAGSASYPAAFASAAAGNTVGASVLDAGLTFVAPQSKAAGTYNSTLTLTVVSK
jgi:hypothetical protein